MQTIPFEDLPSTDTPIDADNLNLMQSYIKQAINDKIGLITLLEASNTAPNECQLGDLYYNTDTTLIYEATGTNTWNTVGSAPSYDYLYLDKKNKVIYYFNDTELDVFGAAVVDDLASSSTVNPPSIDAVNSAISDINDSIDNIETTKFDKPTRLYFDSNGSSGNINLSDSTSNYSYLEIFYKRSENYASSVKIDLAITKKASLTSTYYTSGGSFFIDTKNIEINNTSISVTNNAVMYSSGGNVSVGTNNNIQICEVLGYK